MSLKLSDALWLADFFMPHFESVCEPGCCKVAGGTRREKPFVHDLEFVLKPLDQRPPLQFGIKPNKQPKTMLDIKLNELVQQEYLFFQQGADRNKKYYVNLEKFDLSASHASDDKKNDETTNGGNNEFKLDLWITVPPAQYGVNMVIRTGPGHSSDNFSKWVVTQRSDGGALPDGYRVFKAAVWHVGQFRSQERLYEGECPKPMPTEEDFMAFLGWSPIDEIYKPSSRHADWGRYTR